MTANGNSSPGSAGYALGDLDIDLGRSNAPAQAPAHGRATHADRDDLDLSGFEGADASAVLELADAYEDAPWRGRLATLEMAHDEDDPLNANACGASPELEEVPRAGRLRPQGTELQAEAISQTADQRARELGDYGPSPAGLFGSIPYAFGVLRRKRHLATNRRLLTRQLDELNGRLDEALADLGRALIKHEPSELEAVRDAHAAALAAREAADAADQTAAHARRDTEAQIRELETLIAERKQAVAPFQQALEEASLAQRAATEARTRAEAMRKRVDIEMRAQEGAQGSLDSHMLRDLNERRDQRDTDLAQAQAQLDTANEVLEARRRELSTRQREIDAVDKQRRKLADQADRAQRKLENAAEGAVGALTRQLRALGRAACDAGVALGGDRARRVRELDKLAGELVDQKELHRLAQSRYDPAAFRRGMTLWVLLSACAVGGIAKALLLP